MREAPSIGIIAIASVPGVVCAKALMVAGRSSLHGWSVQTRHSPLASLRLQ